MCSEVEYEIKHFALNEKVKACLTVAFQTRRSGEFRLAWVLLTDATELRALTN